MPFTIFINWWCPSVGYDPIPYRHIDFHLQTTHRDKIIDVASSLIGTDIAAAPLYPPEMNTYVVSNARVTAEWPVNDLSPPLGSSAK